jgi:hypothetical protein
VEVETDIVFDNLPNGVVVTNFAMAVTLNAALVTNSAMVVTLNAVVVTNGTIVDTGHAVVNSANVLDDSTARRLLQASWQLMKQWRCMTTGMGQMFHL